MEPEKIFITDVWLYHMSQQNRRYRYGFWDWKCNSHHSNLLPGRHGLQGNHQGKDEVIPVICGVTGGILGVAGMYLMPEFPATDVINAAAIGIVSGLAATGANQIIKQVGKM